MLYTTKSFISTPRRAGAARAALTVDCVVFGLDDDDVKVMLIQRASPPFAGTWALPGGFVRVDETLEEAARRARSQRPGRDRRPRCRWFGVHDVPSLAFDHADILQMALDRLRGKVRYQAGFNFEL